MTELALLAQNKRIRSRISGYGSIAGPLSTLRGQMEVAQHWCHLYVQWKGVAVAVGIAPTTTNLDSSMNLYWLWATSVFSTTTTRYASRSNRGRTELRLLTSHMIDRVVQVCAAAVAFFVCVCVCVLFVCATGLFAVW